jgi:hypothetical protein
VVTEGYLSDPTTADLSTGPVGCRTATVIRRQRALVGVQQWAIELDVHWCYGFGLVRTIDQYKFVSCCGLAWSFDDWLVTEFAPAGDASARSFVQARFKYSIAWFQGNKTPWIAIVVHGDGTADMAWG